MGDIEQERDGAPGRAEGVRVLGPAHGADHAMAGGHGGRSEGATEAGADAGDEECLGFCHCKAHKAIGFDLYHDINFHDP